MSAWVSEAVCERSALTSLALLGFFERTSFFPPLNHGMAFFLLHANLFSSRAEPRAWPAAAHILTCLLHVNSNSFNSSDTLDKHSTRM